MLTNTSLLDWLKYPEVCQKRLTKTMRGLFTGNQRSFISAATLGVIRKGSETNISHRKWTDANTDKYFRRIYFLKQQTKSRNEKEDWEWVYGGEREGKVPFKCPSGESVLSENQSELEGFHLKENVKYSLKQFNEAKDRKEPRSDSPPGKANTDQNWCHSSASHRSASTPSWTIFGMLNTLKSCMPGGDRWPRLTQV